MEPFRQKGSSMASWSTFIFKSVVQIYRRYYCISKSSMLHSFPDKETKALVYKPTGITVSLRYKSFIATDKEETATEKM